MADLNTKSSPFYDSSEEEYNKGYTSMLFNPGLSVQHRELTGIGELANKRINEVVSNVLGNNKILNGGTISNIDLVNHKVYITETKAVIDGYITVCEAGNLTITASGTESIYIELVQEIITYLDDASLVDPAEGYDNYGNDGAYRKKTYSRFCLTPSGTKNIKLAELTNGVITWKLTNETGIATTDEQVTSDTSDVLRIMKQRTYETSGNYLVSGFTPTIIDCLDDNKIGISLTDGVAYVEGERIETVNKNVFIPRKGIKNSVENELITSKFDKSHGYEYQIGNGNVTKINSIMIPCIITEDRIKGVANGLDALGNINVISIVSVKQGITTYTVTTDYVLSGNNIDWSPEGSEPAVGSTYSVTYSYNKTLTSDKYTLSTGKKEDIYYTHPEEIESTYEISTINSDYDNIYIKNVYSGVTAVSSAQTLTPDENNVCDLGHTLIKYKSVVLIDNGTTKTEDTHYIVNYSTGEIYLKFTPIGTVTATYDYFTTKLTKNYHYSVVRNKIYFSLASSDSIPVAITKTNGAYDVLPSGSYKAIRYYSKDNGFILYDSTSDYSLSGNQLTFLSSNKPINGDSYVIDLVSGASIVDATSIYIEYMYETDAEALDSSILYPSVVLIDEDMSEGGQIRIAYDFYSPRIDYILLDKTGIITDEIGPAVSKNYANSMTIPPSKVLLAKFYTKPHSTEGKVIPSTNYRVRMSDIRQMYSDIGDIKYNIAMTDLEREAESSAPASDMRGIFTDNFDSLNKLDTGYAWLLADANGDGDAENYPLHIAIPTVGVGALMMNYTSAQKELTVNSTNTTATLMNGKYYMAGNGVGGYTERLWQTQTKATKPRSLAEGLTSCRFVPIISITPDSYMFVDEAAGVDKIVNNIIDNSIGINMQRTIETDLILLESNTSTVGVGTISYYNTSFQNVTGTTEVYSQTVTDYYKNISNSSVNLGSYISDVETVLNLKQITITVNGSGFVPLQDYIECYFDNKRAALTISGGIGTNSTLLAGAIKCNASGNFRATFVIPSGCRYGIREVKITCPGGISVTKDFFGSGLKTTSSSTTLNTTLIDVESKTHTDIITKTITSKGPIFSCRSYCGTTPLCQTLYVNNMSLSNFTLSDIEINSDVFVTSSNIYFRYCYPDETTTEVFFAGFMPLNDSGVPVSDPENLGPGKWVGEIYQRHNTEIYPLVNVTGADRATVPYLIDWKDKPINLFGGKGYGFIVGDVNFESKIWVAEVGTTQTFNDVTTNTPVTTEPARGILLSSPNGQTWATYITEDIKYDMYIADFSTGSNVQIITDNTGTYYKTEVEFNEITTTSELDGKKANFFILNGNYVDSYDGSAYVQFYYKVDSNDSWIPFNLEEKVEFLTAATTITIKAILISKNKYNSPIVSPNFGVILGRYSNTGYYVSRSAVFNEFNKISCYLDKIYNGDSGTTIETYYSVDNGQLWKHLSQAKYSKLLYQDSERIISDSSKARMYQWGYEDNILLSNPKIKDNSIVLDTGGSLTDATTYYYKVSMMNHDKSETNITNCTARNKLTTTGNQTIKFIIQMDPSASGFKVYRSIDDTTYSVIYNSTAESTATSLVSTTLSLTDASIFPNSGRIKVTNQNDSSQYRWYNYTGKSTNDLTGLSSTNCGNYSSDISYNIVSGDKVELFDFDIVSTESINGAFGGNGKIPILTDEVDTTGKKYYITDYNETGACEFLFTDDGVRFASVTDANTYSADKPPYIKANSIKFLIKMYNNTESNMDHKYSLPEVRRFISTCTFNSDLLL